MAARRLTAVDAQTHWMSSSIPSDQFLLYAFGGGAVDVESALGVIRGRAQACAEYGVRIADTAFWSYPEWMRREVGSDQFVVHAIADPTWAGCLDAVAAMVEAPLDASVQTWKMHVFPEIAGLPGGTGTVAVFQIAHSLGDGMRASALAAHLFGRAGDIPAPAPTRARTVAMPFLALRAAHAHRRLERDTAAGLVPAQAVSRPALHTNREPAGRRYLRTVICDRRELRGPTVTVGALAAISSALAGHLRVLGDDPSQLAAEIPMAKSGPRASNNHYGNAGVGLYPGEAFDRRIGAIAADLAARRRRFSHWAMRAESAAFAAVPAPLLRWGVQQFDPRVRSDTVTGNTVVSSVNRGSKDLTFGDAPVLLTAGFPGLSPMMGVTHGVHGIGDTVAISVHAAESSIGDIDTYLERLEGELRPGR